MQGNSEAMASDQTIIPADEPAEPSLAYAWYVVFVLILAYTVSYIDRQILTLLVQPIKTSLQISDVEISLLHGLAFAIFYTVLGIPIARLADRHKRTTIISIGILFWSVMTAACGLARSFGQLFAARVGVGVGEAALGPAAYSTIADYFPAKKLAKALSLYTGAIYFGAGIAMIAGGTLIGLVPATTLPLIGPMEPWQLVFMIVAIPGVFVAMLTATLREPKRKGIKTATDVFPSVREVGQYVRDRRACYAFLILGFSASSLMWNGVSGWIPTYFIRMFGWTPAEVGLRYGLVLFFCGSIGIYSGGMLSGWLRERGHLDSNIRLGILSAVAAIPTGVLAPLMPTAGLSLFVFALFVFAGSMPYGGAAAALQEITPNRMRAQVTAIYFLGLNLAGIGLGPTVVALFTDKLFGDEMLIRYSLSLTVMIGAPLCIVLLMLARKPYRKAFADFNG